VCSVVNWIPKYIGDGAKGSRKLAVLTMVSRSVSDWWCFGERCVHVQVHVVVQEMWIGLVGLGVGNWSYCEQCDR
jgi:hypothetical protein